MFRHALIWSILLATVLASRSGEAQLAPTGTHYAGRPSDTGFTGPTDHGGYSASVPLDLPPSRSGLPVPLQIVFGAKGFGAAGVGWDIPLSYVYVDHTFAHRRPAVTSTRGIAARERVTVSLLGRSIEMLVQGDHWIARNDPTMTMKAVDGTWQVVDASGVSYTFLKNPYLYATGGPGIADPGGLWLLDSIEGAAGAKVQLDYKISTVDASPEPDPLITIDLQDIKYNPDPSKTCFKHEIDLLYDEDEDGASPQALSILGERVIARFHKLDYVVVQSRGGCADVPNQLRSYELKYATDQDTQQWQLSSVLEHGRPDIPSDTQSIPVATYRYGTASTLVDTKPVLQYGDPKSITVPTGASHVASTGKTSLFSAPVSGTSYAASQTLQDFNGDGRADLVYTPDATGVLTIAVGLPGGLFAAPVPATDNVFTRNVLDARSSDHERFLSESIVEDVTKDFVWTESIDVNGDGRIDVLDAAEKPNTWVAYLNTPDPGPSGIKWVRQELDVTRLRQQLVARGLNVPADYLPLSSRKTARNLAYIFHWKWVDGNWKRATLAFDIPEPGVLSQIGQEQTYTEYKIMDVNGDGYPDVVFNGSETDYSDVISPDDPRSSADGNGNFYKGQWQTFGPKGLNTVSVAYNISGIAVEASGTNPFADPVDLIVQSDCGVEWWSGNDSNDRRQASECSFTDVNGDGLLDRVEYSTVSLGTGFSFRTVQIQVPTQIVAAQDSMYADQCNQGADHSSAIQSVGLRDLTGDGIPDLVVSSAVDYLEDKVYVGTGGGFSKVPLSIAFSVSSSNDRCDGSYSWTEGGLYDVNGDGRPDLVASDGTGLIYSQLIGSGEAGEPEAGRLTGIDNGYGASISVTYTSAKEDRLTPHDVPFPEIVVSSIKTDGKFGLGGDLAATNYAFGNIGMFYDSIADAFRSIGYLRRVEVTTVGTAKDGSPVANATITDAYPLQQVTPLSFHYMTEKQRLGRYLQAGRISDTTSLAGEIGTDPWALLSVDVTTDIHRIAGTHYSVDTNDTRYYADAASPSNEACVDVAFQYDFNQSNLQSTYDACSARGFLYTSSTQSWRGSEAPPSLKNVQVYTSVRSVDDFGRVTSIIYQNDASQTDDDVCVDTTYASPTDPVLHVLTAPASKKVWACGIKEDGHTVAEESWEYDKQYPGLVFEGLPTAHTIYRHATDTGALLGVNREYDADYDAMGNPISVTSTRDDGAWRRTTIATMSSGSPRRTQPSSAQTRPSAM